MEVDSTQAQDQDQELFNLIQALTTSLSKTQAQQFLKTQIADPNIQKMLAQSVKELKWQNLQKSPQGILYCAEDGCEQVLVP